MGGVKKALFGSSDKISSTPAQVYPEWSYQKNIREGLTDTATGLLGNASQYINQGAGLLSSAASGELSGGVKASLKNQAMDLFDKQSGSIANNMAFKNLGSNTMTQNALSQAAGDASDWYMNNYMQALGQQGQLASGLVSAGNSMMEPAQGLYSQWLSAQMGLSSPAQTVVKQGSSGLLGSALSGWASGGFKLPS